MGFFKEKVNRTKEESPYSNVEQLSKGKLHEQTIFYTECCLFATLVIYLLTKFAKLEEEINETSLSNGSCNEVKIQPIHKTQIKSPISTNEAFTQTEREDVTPNIMSKGLRKMKTIMLIY